MPSAPTDARSGSSDLRPVGTAPAPGSVRRVLLGFRCNNACILCAQGRLRDTGALETDADAGPSLAETMFFLGGEPTLDETLLQRVGAAAAGGARRVVVQTNGRRLAYREYADALAAAGAGRLLLDVSLLGSTREMHDFHTATAGSFAQTVAGLRNARARGVSCGVSVIVTRSNYRHLSEIVRVAHAVGARALRFAVVQPLGSARQRIDSLAPPPRLLRPRLDAAVREASRLGVAVVSADAHDSDLFPFAGLGTTERSDVLRKLPVLR